MTTNFGAAGKAEAQRRFGKPTPGVSSPKQSWTLEDLFEPGARGRAQAAARQGNTSARTALADFDRAIKQLAATVHDEPPQDAA